jgi:hypothetical protein
MPINICNDTPVHNHIFWCAEGQCCDHWRRAFQTLNTFRSTGNISSSWALFRHFRFCHKYYHSITCFFWRSKEGLWCRHRPGANLLLTQFLQFLNHVSTPLSAKHDMSFMPSKSHTPSISTASNNKTATHWSFFAQTLAPFHSGQKGTRFLVTIKKIAGNMKSVFSFGSNKYDYMCVQILFIRTELRTRWRWGNYIKCEKFEVDKASLKYYIPPTTIITIIYSIYTYNLH